MGDTVQIDQSTLLKLVRDVEQARTAAESALRVGEEIKKDLNDRLNDHDIRIRELEKGHAQTRTWGAAAMLLLTVAVAVIEFLFKR